jgi:hypothetical protein
MYTNDKQFGVCPAVAGASLIWLELLWPQQRYEQINEQSERNDADKNVFHGSKPPACIGVHNTYGEKSDNHRNKQNVLHIGFSWFNCTIKIVKTTKSGGNAW